MNQPYNNPGYATAGPGPVAPGPRRPSRAPALIAAGVVLALAIVVALVLVLRDGDEPPTTVTLEQLGPVEVTQALFEALDDGDDEAAAELSRGDAVSDVEDILDSGTMGFAFGTGELLDDAATQTDGVEIAVVQWRVVDKPADAQDMQTDLTVGLLNAGEGFQVCQIEALYGGSVSDQLDDWADDYAEACSFAE